MKLPKGAFKLYFSLMAQQKGYGQFCPVSRAAEILTERWTPLIVRELQCGSTRFNDLQRGVPRMSSALLSRRLKELEYAGVIERTPMAQGRGSEYHLTQSGKELSPIIQRMGIWAQRWVRDDLTRDENLDPDLLMWDIRRTVTTDGIPADRRFVVLFQFSGVMVNRRRYWLMFDQGDVDICVRDPGFDVDLYISSHVKTLTQIWLGHLSIGEASRDGQLTFDGTRNDIKAFASWFALSPMAKAGREPPGESM
jgi:DNA-binding HxlR family transcriptional regulator